MNRPHAGAQASVFNKILDAANVDPLDVSYIEMHGTGTQAGDAVEMKSVLDGFAPGQRGSEHPLHLGSAKANVGHAESGSGYVHFKSFPSKHCSKLRHETCLGSLYFKNASHYLSTNCKWQC